MARAFLYLFFSVVRQRGSPGMKILILNCGSSSVKYEVFDIDDQAETVLASGSWRK